MKIGTVLKASTLLLATSCSSLTPVGEKVRVTSNPEAVRNCTLLGEVKGAEHMWGGWAGQGIAENNAYIELKNRTAAMGGDTALMVSTYTGFSGSTQRAEAYNCSSSFSVEKRSALESVHISDFDRRKTTDAKLTGSFTITNDNPFAVASLVVHCEVSGIGGDSRLLPAIGAHRSLKIDNASFSGDGIPDGPAVCKVADLTVVK